MRAKLNNKLMLAAFDDYVTGHSAAKKALIVMLNRSRMRCEQKYIKYMSQEFLLNPLKVLLLGGSGTGKTHLVNSLEQIANVPIVKIDATDLNPTGASGGIKSEKIISMIESAAREKALLFPEIYPYVEYAIDQTIVYVDEIDKLGQSFDSSGNWNKHVQSNFLTTFDNKAELAGVSFIFSGAFDSITRKKIAQNAFGFTKHVEPEMPKDILDEKILACGIIPELLGRINTVIELDSFTKDEYIEIIYERILPKKKRDLAAYDLFDVELSHEDVESIAEAAVRSNQGVRYVQRAVDKMFLDKEFDAGCDDSHFLLETF